MGLNISNEKEQDQINVLYGDIYLKINKLIPTLKKIQTLSKNKYLMVESYRNEKELFNLQCWALTCKTFFTPTEWKWIFKKSKFSGDFEFIYF